MEPSKYFLRERPRALAGLRADAASGEIVQWRVNTAGCATGRLDPQRRSTVAHWSWMASVGPRSKPSPVSAVAV